MTAATLRRSDFGIATALVITGVVLTVARPDVPQLVGQFHDDGIYAVTAKSLADGRGYLLAHLPNAPPQTKYPPLYPMMLATIWRVSPGFPNNVRSLECIGVLGCAISLAGGYLYLVRYGYASRPLAGLAAIGAATSSTYLGLGTLLMAELPFAATVLVALATVERTLAGHGPRLFWLGVAIALPALVRLPGIVLVPVALGLLVRTRRPVRTAALGAALPLGAWFAWVCVAAVSIRHDPVTGYYTDYLGWWANVGIGGFVRIVAVNIVQAFQGIVLQTLSGAATYLVDVPSLLFALLGLLTVPGILRDLQHGRPLAWFLAAYIALIVTWPWPPERFLLPLQLPFTVYLLKPLELLLTRRWLWLPLGVGVTAANFGVLSAKWELHRVKGYEALTLQPTDADWAAYQRLFRWVREKTPVEAVLASPVDPTVALYAERTAFNPFIARPGPLFYGLAGEPFPTSDQLASYLRTFRAGFVIHLPMPGGDDKFYFQHYAELERSGVLQRVYTDPSDARLVAYRVADP